MKNCLSMLFLNSVAFRQFHIFSKILRSHSNSILIDNIFYGRDISDNYIAENDFIISDLFCSNIVVDNHWAIERYEKITKKSINELIILDRHVLHLCEEQQLLVIECCLRWFFDWLSLHDAREKFVISEGADDFISVAACYLSEYLDFSFVFPNQARIGNRFWFAEDLKTAPLLFYDERKRLENNYDEVKLTIDEWGGMLTLSDQIPTHFHTSKNFFEFRFSKVLVLIRYLKRWLKDPNALYYRDLGLADVIKRGFFRPLFFYRMLWSDFVLGAEDIERISSNSRVILWPLHFEPEASTLVYGRNTFSQYEAIKSLAAKLPSDWVIVVVEHPHGQGRRDLGFFERLGSLPRVYVAGYKFGARDLMPFCSVVATISGTAALEGLLAGKKAIIFGDIFFDCDSRNVLKIERFAFESSLRDFLSAEFDGYSRDVLVAAILRCSFELDRWHYESSYDEDVSILVREFIERYLKRSLIQ